MAAEGGQNFLGGRYGSGDGRYGFFAILEEDTGIGGYGFSRGDSYPDMYGS